MVGAVFGCFEDVSTLSAAEVRHKVSRLEWLYQISFSWQVDGDDVGLVQVFPRIRQLDRGTRADEGPIAASAQ